MKQEYLAKSASDPVRARVRSGRGSRARTLTRALIPCLTLRPSPSRTLPSPTRTLSLTITRRGHPCPPSPRMRSRLFYQGGGGERGTGGGGGGGRVAEWGWWGWGGGSRSRTVTPISGLIRRRFGQAHHPVSHAPRRLESVVISVVTTSRRLSNSPHVATVWVSCRCRIG